jgi:hypothetical protein
VGAGRARAGEEGAAWPDALRRSLGLLLKEQDDVEIALEHAELLGLR